MMVTGCNVMCVVACTPISVRTPTRLTVSTPTIAAERGLMQKTKLTGPTLLAKKRQTGFEHLLPYNVVHSGRTRNLTTEQRKTMTANPVRRREHELKKTPPERMRAPLEALYGDPRGHPDAFLVEVVDMFLEELANGQRGVYKWMGVRMGTDWSVARSRVWSAIRRGHLIWTGDDLEPAGHRPGEQPWHPPGSFEHMFGMLEQWVAEHGHARVPKAERVGDVKLGYWVQSLRLRYRKGNLSGERVQRLEALSGWSWKTRPSPSE